MKNWIVVFIILILLVIGFNFTLHARTFSFQDVIPIDRDKVSSIEIEYKDQKVVMKNKEKMLQLVDELSIIKLKNTKNRMDSTKSSLDEPYWIRVFEDGKEKYGLTLYGQDDLESFDFSKTKNKPSEYRIVDGNHVDIGKYIK
ncbi:hypothetical protein [Bacillus sp. NPDC093026]|uniref:hypothetical protein n=1 Tax=Bacillus sp. NPDC093026 TaxID=3363948 RepID=UPI003819D54F